MLVKYVHITRNISKYMKKYTVFYMWFGTISQSSVTPIVFYGSQYSTRDGTIMHGAYV